MTARQRWPLVLSLLAYTALTAIIGRDVLLNARTTIANDAGDPLLTTSILHWNATHVPYTDAWYQFPIFHPSADVMTFSEHLLGLSVIASPIHWLTGDPVLTYNVTMLLTFVLSAAAMYALVLRLTGHAGAAFVAGIAYGFAPFRISQLPHVQMLAVFHAPVALLGLHAYLDTGRRRWLALYGTAWALQGAANAYMMLFFSVLVGLWLLWFVVARARWRDLAAIGLTTIVAALPLLPILLRYVDVHAQHGFVRDIEEIKLFSADIAAVLCAPERLTLWGWIRVGCRPEGELFPGVAVMLFAVAALLQALGWRAGTMATLPRPVRLVMRLLLAVAVVYTGVALSVWWLGRWRLDLGFVTASASSMARPLLVAVSSATVAALLPMAFRLASLRSTTSFYLLAAVVTWVLSLGPRLRLMDVSISYDGPYAPLLFLPGFDGLRVPARFWMDSVLCLAVVAGLYLASVLEGRSRRSARLVVGAAALAVLGDGWVDRIAAVDLPPAPPNEARLAGRTVLELPVDGVRDIAATYRAVVGGWRTVNGYSGYGPNYYLALQDAVRADVDDFLPPFQALGPLELLVPNSDPRHQQVVASQPGMAIVGRNAYWTQYSLPARPRPAQPTGRPVSIARLEATCGTPTLPLALDRDEQSRWNCGPQKEDQQQLMIDLGAARPVNAIMHGVGVHVEAFPRRLTIETSVDGQSWAPAWAGDAWGRAIAAGVGRPGPLRIVFPFDTVRNARFVRLTHPPMPETFYWTISELQVWE